MTRGRIRFTAVLAVAVLAALAIWLVVSAGNSGQPSQQAQAQGTTPQARTTLTQRSNSGATILPITVLRQVVRKLHTPVYWVGPRAKVNYEFTAAAGGRTYVRYLPKGVKAGDPRPDFLTIGTYVIPHPLADLRRASRARGAETTHLPGGGLALMNRSRPTSAFIARPGWKAQVEVYDPKPGMAMALILNGDVRAVR